MDYDRNQFLQDVFERLLALPGDPMLQFEQAVHEEIQYMVKNLQSEARSERDHILTMAEQRKKNPKQMVKTLWRTAGNYDRRVAHKPGAGDVTFEFPTTEVAAEFTERVTQSCVRHNRVVDVQGGVDAETRQIAKELRGHEAR